MEPRDYLNAFRRRWKIVVGAAAVGVAAAVVLGTVASAPLTPPSEFSATTVILSTDAIDPNNAFRAGPNLDTLAELATLGDVPLRVAEKIEYDGDPLDLTADVTAFADTETGLLRITATAEDGDQAKLLADTFAKELIGSLSDRESQQVLERAADTQKRMEKLRKEIDALDSQIGSNESDELLVSERDARVRQYGLLYETYQQLANQSAQPTVNLQVIQEASPGLVTPAGFGAPRTPLGRMIFGGILGLLAGVALALFRERLDVRIRNRKDVERHYGLPVLAEVPQLSSHDNRKLHRGKKKGSLPVMSAQRPKSPTADAFRLLGLTVTRLDGTGSATGTPPRTILVTSGGPKDGKTTVVANLAAVFGRLGKRVILLSCDFHRPDLHKFFNIPNHKGLSQALAEGSDWSVLNGNVHTTDLPNVRLVPSGPPPADASSLLNSERMRRVVEEARRNADIVIIDTPPIMAVSDATQLLREADAVVVVARSGRTTPDEAERTMEILRRFDASITGVVLNGVSSEQGYYRYYRYYGNKPENGDRKEEKNGSRKAKKEAEQLRVGGED